ncbi:MAG: carboxypeptidase regulatory-like domain-containing protein [Ruminococcaceae bacterium]|nr:carboxypeptidase regulatory-like domain-containing protein [Oscillospiraceae bacterium]
MNKNDPERSYGKFGVRAFAANSAYPVANALVIVRGKKANGSPTTIAVLETDESGKTQIITLETPPKSLSLSPGSDIPPYSLYDVEITHPGFYSIITRDVQIYPDTTSILPINMLPLPDTNSGSNIIINSGGTAPNL